jgi:hypothetical protein
MLRTFDAKVPILEGAVVSPETIAATDVSGNC